MVFIVSGLCYNTRMDSNSSTPSLATSKERLEIIMPVIYQEVEVEVELDDFDTDELLEELENRGELINNDDKQLIDIIFHKRRAGQDFSQELDDLIYNTIGRFE
jgi:hypothetical protein